MREPRHLRIVGGPAPQEVRVYDSETGADLSSLCTGGIVIYGPRDGLMRVSLNAFAEVDMTAVEVVDKEA